MKRIATLLIFLLLLLAPLYFRCAYDAARNLELARSARNAGKDKEAIEYYRRSISWRAPFNTIAYETFLECHQYILTLKDEHLKLDAFRELRSAYLGSRSFIDSLPATSNAEEETRAIMKGIDTEINALVPTAEKRDRHLTIGSTYKENYLFQILAQIAFWGWVASTFIFIWRGFTVEGKFVREAAVLPAITVVGFYAAWLLLLGYA